jgi:enoyl-CoA hydratase/carnithine racemase
MTSLVQRHDKDGVATLILNRPDKLNALSRDMFEVLDDHIEAIARDTKRIGLVVLRGANGTFSSGYDMKEIADSVRGHAKPHYQSEVIEKLAHLPQPVISAVQGQCSTGALELALAADLVVCTDSSEFSDAYARWGLTPIWGLSLRLPRRVGSAKAREMLFTCRTIMGKEAEDIHLANFCFSDDRFEADLDALCKQILANSWYSNRVTKRVLIETDALPLSEAHALDMFKNEGLAPDAEERVAAFFNRKKP